MQNNPRVKLHVTEHLLLNVLISWFALRCAEFKLLLTSSAPSEFVSPGELKCGLRNVVYVTSIEAT